MTELRQRDGQKITLRAPGAAARTTCRQAERAARLVESTLARTAGGTGRRANSRKPRLTLHAAQPTRAAGIRCTRNLVRTALAATPLRSRQKPRQADALSIVSQLTHMRRGTRSVGTRARAIADAEHIALTHVSIGVAAAHVAKTRRIEQQRLGAIRQRRNANRRGSDVDATHPGQTRVWRVRTPIDAEVGATRRDTLTRTRCAAGRTSREPARDADVGPHPARIRRPEVRRSRIRRLLRIELPGVYLNWKCIRSHRRVSLDAVRDAGHRFLTPTPDCRDQAEDPSPWLKRALVESAADFRAHEAVVLRIRAFVAHRVAPRTETHSGTIRVPETDGRSRTGRRLNAGLDLPICSATA